MFFKKVSSRTIVVFVGFQMLIRFVLITLRLFPPIATNSCMANKDTVIPVGGGRDGNSPLFVARNDVVTYSTFVMHRRPELFGPDALEFRPERWEELRPGWEYLPFQWRPENLSWAEVCDDRGIVHRCQIIAGFLWDRELGHRGFQRTHYFISNS